MWTTLENPFYVHRTFFMLRPFTACWKCCAKQGSHNAHAETIERIFQMLRTNISFANIRFVDDVSTVGFVEERLARFLCDLRFARQQKKAGCGSDPGTRGCALDQRAASQRQDAHRNLGHRGCRIPKGPNGNGASRSRTEG